MADIFGFDAVLNYKAGGVSSGGSWTPLTNVKDVTLNLESDTADTTTRANSGWKSTVATLKDGTVEFDMIWRTTDAGFTAIKDAYFNGSAIGIQVLDGTDGEGLEADFVVTKFTRNEQLAEALMVSVSLNVTYVDTAPVWNAAS